jgi:predicted metalloprotease with PDZ domain
VQITSSLWIAEVLTTYCGDLIVVRAGLGSTEDYLSAMSSHIDQLQNSPGRLLQSLEQASQDVWKSGTSGVGRDRATKVSYYVKGPVVGWLLDARIRRETEDKQSLDNPMRLAYRRYSGGRAFTPEEFRRTAEEVAGTDLKEWFRNAISSAEELDYTPALDWYGLRFAPPEEPEKTSDAAGEGSSKKDEPKKKEPEGKWKLQIRSDATEAQKRHLRSLLGPDQEQDED